ncbi:hypothetical protein J6590_010855 [Homalodisca vitripennis]|nr:hypothetical protein J6590_010855 [Homalodisca vitripennis]
MKFDVKTDHTDKHLLTDLKILLTFWSIRISCCNQSKLSLPVSYCSGSSVRSARAGRQFHDSYSDPTSFRCDQTTIKLASDPSLPISLSPLFCPSSCATGLYEDLIKQNKGESRYSARSMILIVLQSQTGFEPELSLTLRPRVQRLRPLGYRHSQC